MSEKSLAEHRTARHLDDPTPILAGLGLLQLLGVCLGAVCAFLTWQHTAFLSGSQGVGYYGRITVAFFAFALPAGSIYVQCKGKVEPFGAQLLGYAVRPHRYRAAAVDRSQRA